MNKAILIAALGMIGCVLNSQAAQVNILDIFNLTGVGGPTTPLNTNSGGGNQHQQSKNPVFSFAGATLPRMVFQRSQFNGQGNSYLQIYKGTVTQNQAPPAGSPVLIGSDTEGLADPSSPPDFLIDYSNYVTPGSVAEQIWNFLSADPTATYTIAVVEVTLVGNNPPKPKATTIASFQFNFANLSNSGGQPTLNISLNTQLGNSGQ